MPIAVPPAIDNDPMPDTDAGQDWLISWHPPETPPTGIPHGASAICLTVTGEVVLVLNENKSWTIPGGRPEPDESWEDTLIREVREEACATVTSSTLLGWGQGQCLRGYEAGKVLVRSLWLAHVELQPWQPAWETTERILVPTDQALQNTLPYLTLAHQRMHTRLHREAMRKAGIDVTSP